MPQFFFFQFFQFNKCLISIDILHFFFSFLSNEWNWTFHFNINFSSNLPVRVWNNPTLSVFCRAVYFVPLMWWKSACPQLDVLLFQRRVCPYYNFVQCVSLSVKKVKLSILCICDFRPLSVVITVQKSVWYLRICFSQIYNCVFSINYNLFTILKTYSYVKSIYKIPYFLKCVSDYFNSCYWFSYTKTVFPYIQLCQIQFRDI